jgi:hypothetical protein
VVGLLSGDWDPERLPRVDMRENVAIFLRLIAASRLYDDALPRMALGLQLALACRLPACDSTSRRSKSPPHGAISNFTDSCLHA